MTLREATERGIGKLRLPVWNKYAHVDLYLMRDGAGSGEWGHPPAGEGPLLSGPWARLYDPCGFLAMDLPANHFHLAPAFMMQEDTYESWIEPEDNHRFAEQGIGVPK